MWYTDRNVWRGERVKLLLAGASVYRGGRFDRMDVSIDGERIASVAPFIDPQGFDQVLPVQDKCLIPGLVDVHVHLREPGFSYKETIRSGSLAAARGGYTAVCAMPNLSPTPDSAEHLRPQLDLIARDAATRVYPYGTISVGEKGEALSDLGELRPFVCGYSDDGRGVMDDGLMRQAMLEVKRLDAILAAHCEDAREADSARAEWKQVERDLALAAETGCRYHVCHISTKQSVDLIRRAKARGVDVSCETAPHYLLLTTVDVRDDGRFKMNPPIRGQADREALMEGLLDGTIDMIATDHAPHSAEEKARGFDKSVMGIVGLETALPLMLTHFVKPGILSLEKLVERMAVAPRRRFCLPGGEIGPGQVADLTLVDLGAEHKIDPDAFLSMGRSTPFAGWDVCGRPVLTMVNGEVKYDIQRGN